MKAENKEKDQSLENDSIQSILSFNDNEVDPTDDPKSSQVEHEEKLLAEEDLLDNESDQEPQEESDSNTKEDDVVDGAEEGADKKEAATNEKDDFAKKFSDLEERLKETQKWGKTKNQEATEFKKKLEALVADGTVDKEALDALKIEEDNPITEIREQFESEFETIQQVMVGMGEDKDDVEEYAVAFDTMSQYDRSLTQYIIELPRKERILAIISKGKTMVDDYKVIKEHKGNLREVFKAIEKRAVEAYKKSLEGSDGDEEVKEVETKVETKVAATPPKNTRPKLKQAGGDKQVVEEDNSMKGILFNR